MARTRSIKPGFFRNEILASLPYQDRLLFAGLWTIADRDGRLEDRPLRIRVDIFPYDHEIDIEGCLVRLAAHNFIQRYQVGENKYICIPSWRKHQSPHLKEQPSTIQAPDMHGASTSLAHPSTLPPYIPSTLKPETESEPRMRQEFDDQWQSLKSDYERLGKPLIEEDWQKAHFVWRLMDHFQKELALTGISERVMAGQWDDPNFIPLPEKYLKTEYRRKVISRKSNGKRGLSAEDIAAL